MRIKKLIFILVILVLIIASLIVILQFNLDSKKDETIKNEGLINNKTNPVISFDEVYEESYEKEIITTLSTVNDRVKYFTTKKCVEEYLEYLKNSKYDEAYQLIDKYYISSQNLTIDEFKIRSFEQNALITEIKEIDLDKINSLYYIFLNGNNFASFIVSVNYEKLIFAIIPEGNLPSDYKNINEEQSLNKYNYIAKPDESYVKELLKDYIEKALLNTELAYNYLNEEYRDKKFRTLDNYKQFIEGNKEMFMLYDPTNAKQPGDFSSYEEWQMYFNSLKLLEVKEYSIKPYDGYTEYIIVDTYDNYYIFKETSVMNYEIMLDTYTIGTSTFLEEYNQATNEEKVELNINKIFEAINNKDYNYVYNKLDIEYKITNFSDLEIFKTVMENNFFEENVVEFDDYIEEGNIYRYILTITDATEKDTTEKEIIITMQLGENTDFTVKFE